MIWIFWFILFAIPVIIFTSYRPGITVSPWVPTDKHASKRMLKMAKLTANDVVIDLGCGDGKLLIAAYKEARCAVRGVECAPLQFTMAWVNTLLRRVPAKLSLEDLVTADLQGVTVVFLFLLPVAMAKIKTRLQNELPKGTRIISYSFPFVDWEPDTTDWPKDALPVYKYLVK